MHTPLIYVLGTRHLGALGGPQRIGARAPTFAWVRGIRVGAVQAFRSHDAAEKNPELGLG